MADDAADEQGGIPSTRPEVRPATDAALDSFRRSLARAVTFEGRQIQPKLDGVSAQVTVLEHSLPAQQQLMRIPEPALLGSSLGRGRPAGAWVRVDPGQRKAPADLEQIQAEVHSCEKITRLSAGITWSTFNRRVLGRAGRSWTPLLLPNRHESAPGAAIDPILRYPHMAIIGFR
jgi:hypothetical protein